MSKPVPRDLPDQQAAPDEDPLDVVGVPGQPPESRGPGTERHGAEGEAEDGQEPDAEGHGADEAGTGREGTPDPAGSPAEHPVPGEPAD